MAGLEAEVLDLKQQMEALEIRDALREQHMDDVKKDRMELRQRSWWQRLMGK